MDLFNDIQDLILRLTKSINILAKYGKEFSEAERDYKITLRQEALKLRNDENMPVTLINQIIYGVPEVANKRFKRDVAQAMYDTSKENVNVLKLQLRVLEGQMQREWINKYE